MHNPVTICLPLTAGPGVAIQDRMVQIMVVGQMFLLMVAFQ